MENEFGIAAFLVLCLAWQAHGQVNCTSTGAGRFANPSDTTCQNYTLCVYVSSNNTYLSYNYVCPTTSVFNTTISRCTASTNSVCNVTSSTTSSNTTGTFTCSSAGRFANSTDTTCKTYFLCSLATSGSFVQNTYTCPSTSVFNPNTKRCTTSYTCTTS